MAPSWPRSPPGRGASPHACGDGPTCGFTPACARSFSPRVWGWPRLRIPVGCAAILLPTRVGMARPQASRPRSRWPSPHACGDGPCDSRAVAPQGRFSPRVWGWPYLGGGRDRGGALLPTRVGMALKDKRLVEFLRASPHACGDGPSQVSVVYSSRIFSPRVWGWPPGRVPAVGEGYLLPTRVGMARASHCGGGRRRAVDGG